MVVSIATTQEKDANGAHWRRESEQSQWRIAWRMLRRDRIAMASLAGLVLLGLSAVLAPLLAPYEATRLDYDHPLSPPSPTHWLGTDDLGRDTLSQVLWGGRESLRVGFLGVLIALVGGLLLGLPSAYLGGLPDAVLQRLNDILLAFPTVLLMLSIVAALGPGLATVMIALGIALAPTYARLVRASVLAVKQYEYVTAAQAIGASGGRIMARHILPNIAGPLIVYCTVGLGNAVLWTAALSYIGLGAQPPSPEWGAMLNYGRPFIYSAWWMSVFPGLAITMSVLFINLLGDGLRDALDPKLRS
jgi:peptide/nickel transport system permease protein